MLEAGVQPFVRLLGFETVDRIEIGNVVPPAPRRGGRPVVALLVARWGDRLDPLWRAAVVEATRRGSAWCVLFNGTHVRLIQASRVLSRRFVEFDLDVAADDERTAAAMWMVLGAGALSSADGSSTTALQTLVEESDRQASAICLDRCARECSTLRSTCSARSLPDLMHSRWTRSSNRR